MFTHMHVHTNTHRHTPTWLERMALLVPSLSQSVLRSGGDSDKHFVKTFPPLPAFLSILPSPSPPLSLFLYWRFLLPPNPPSCTQFCSFRHGPVHLTPPVWSPLFHKFEWCEMQWLWGIVPICLQHIQSLWAETHSVFTVCTSGTFSSLDQKCYIIYLFKKVNNATCHLLLLQHLRQNQRNPGARFCSKRGYE